MRSTPFANRAFARCLRLTRNVTTRVRLPMPAPMFTHGERVFVQLPAEHLFEVAT